MTDGGRIGELSQYIVGNECLPGRVVVDESLDMSLQEVGSYRHLGLLITPTLRDVGTSDIYALTLEQN